MAYSRENYIKNKDKILAQVKARYELKKDHIKKVNTSWRLKNVDKVKGYRLKWAESVGLRIHDMHHNAKHRAKVLGIPFSIEYKDLIIPEYCPILGIKLNQEDFRDSTASLDKIIPELGYVPGNIAIISLMANRIKQEGTAEQHRRIADYIEGNLQPMEPLVDFVKPPTKPR